MENENDAACQWCFAGINAGDGCRSEVCESNGREKIGLDSVENYKKILEDWDK